MTLLQTRNLTAFYGDFQALYGIDTMLDAGETIAIIEAMKNIGTPLSGLAGSAGAAAGSSAMSRSTFANAKVVSSSTTPRIQVASRGFL